MPVKWSPVVSLAVVFSAAAAAGVFWARQTGLHVYIDMSLGEAVAGIAVTLAVLVAVAYCLTHRAGQREVRKMKQLLAREEKNRKKALILLARSIKHQLLQRYGQRIRIAAESVHRLPVTFDDPAVKRRFDTYLGQIQASIDDFDTGVDTLGHWSLLEPGSEFSREPIELRLLLDEIIREAEHRYHYRPDRVLAPVPVTVSGNQTLLNAALYNLVDNAIKYSQHKGQDQRVDIKCDLDASHAIITISDNGYGIPTAEQNNIGSFFYRAQNIPAAVEGTGLGLATAISIIQAHGGSIEWFSRQNEYTRFTVGLPIAHCDEPQ